MRRPAVFRSGESLTQPSGREREASGAERRIYSRKVLPEPLALALNVHYSPVIKPDTLTLEFPGEHG